MIMVTNVSVNGWSRSEPIYYNRTPDDAFVELVENELGWGGGVLDLALDKVVVRTNVMGRINTTTFTGTMDEMRPLVEVAAYVTVVCAEKHDEIVDAILHSLHELSSGYGIKSLLSEDFFPIIFGRLVLKPAVLLAFGLGDSYDAEFLCQVSLGDLIAGAQLSRDTGMSLDEVLRETGVTTTSGEVVYA